MKAGVITAVLCLVAWYCIDRSLEYTWQYSCHTDTDCEYEDDVRARVEANR